MTPTVEQKIIDTDYAQAKTIAGFNGYMVTPSGKILSIPRTIKQYNSVVKKTFTQKIKALKELKQYSNGFHLRVELCIEGKRKTAFVKNLVAETFVEKPKGIVKPTVIHKDGDVTNNHYTNLEWVSYSWACRGKVQNY